MLNFAYGSNMLLERLHARVPQARLISIGQLPGWRFALNIRSEDGSAKATAIHTGQPQDVLHGVLYELDEAGKATLDRYEDVGGSYRIEHATAETPAGPREVYLYVGNESRAVEGLAPYDWYLGFILAGARQRRLQAEFIHALETTRAIPDLDGERSVANWKLIPPELR
jgi:gamma-glutamylcyclotransferase